jgi:hypothetical protein
MVTWRPDRIVGIVTALGLLAAGLAGCGPAQPMQRLGGTLTPAPGAAAPAAPPGEPGAAVSEMVDIASPEGAVSTEGQWPDLLFANLYERPAASDGTYLPEIDLTGASLSLSGDWVYVTIRLAHAPAAGMHYSVEFDTDLDARPDVLVTGNPRAGGGWDSQGMRAYVDPDKNIGGTRPRLADPPAPEWDGYENQREGAQSGPQPLIYCRLDPSDPQAVQLAVSLWMLAAPESIAWRAWAEGAVFNPGRQEYNDFHSLEAAGSPYVDSPAYPSRSLVSIDNTCVATYGFEIDQPLPGYCATSLGPLPAGAAAPDDLVYAADGEGVTLMLASGAMQAVPGGILSAAP